MRNDILIFEDDELEILFKAVNAFQFIFHPALAPEGAFCAYDVVRMCRRRITVIVDNNLIIPVCELAEKGQLSDEKRAMKAAVFVLWCKYIGAEVSCGAGLLENGTNGRATSSVDMRKEHFLHAFNNIPSYIWKRIVFGTNVVIPDKYLCEKGKASPDNINYDCSDEYMYLSNVAAITKIVSILRRNKGTPIQQFIKFMYWYTDHLQLADSVTMYAAMVFASVSHVKRPKNYMSSVFDAVKVGILNQAWDLNYLTLWSTMYYDDTDDTMTMFATDDLTQKSIIINIFPKGYMWNSVCSIYKTKREQELLEQFVSEKMGNKRVKPHVGLSPEQKASVVQRLVEDEYKILKDIITEETQT